MKTSIKTTQLILGLIGSVCLILSSCSDTPNGPSTPEEDNTTVGAANSVFSAGGQIPAPPLPGGPIGSTSTIGSTAPIGTSGPIGTGGALPPVPAPVTPVTTVNPAPVTPVNTAPISTAPMTTTTPVAPPPPPQTASAPVPNAPVAVAPPVGSTTTVAPGTGFGYTSGSSSNDDS